MGEESGLTGCLGVLVIIFRIGAVIGTGILAWNWVEPNSFGRVLLFILAWSLLELVANSLLSLIAAGIAALSGEL